jgi:hypothetical protein
MTTIVNATPKDQSHFMVPFLKTEGFIGESRLASWWKDYHEKRTDAGKPHHTGHLQLALCGLGGIGYVLSIYS